MQLTFINACRPSSHKLFIGCTSRIFNPWKLSKYAACIASQNEKVPRVTFDAPALTMAPPSYVVKSPCFKIKLDWDVSVYTFSF